MNSDYAGILWEINRARRLLGDVSEGGFHCTKQKGKVIAEKGWADDFKRISL